MSDGQKGFEYTKGSFWGSATANSWIYRLLAIIPITGFIGLDHLYLRSPGTFILKFILNIITFGFWYFYDLFQSIYFRSDEIGKYGLSAPFVGPLGIGAGIFSNEPGAVGGGVASDETPGSFMFMLYAIAVLIAPFGLDYVIAGDYIGAIIKFGSTFIFGIGLIYGLLNIFNLIVYPGDVLCNGTRRYLPFNLLVSEYNNDVRFTKPGCGQSEGSGGPFGGFFGSMIDWLLDPIKTVVSAVKKVPAETMKVAQQAAKATPSQLISDAKAVTSVTAEAKQMGGGYITEGFSSTKGGAYPRSSGYGQMIEGFKSIPNPPPMLAFVLGILFIGGFYMASRKAVAAYTNYQTERPPEPYTNLNEEENVGDTPPRPSESSVF
jgi:hypothetical protein